MNVVTLHWDDALIVVFNQRLCDESSLRSTCVVNPQRMREGYSIYPSNLEPAAIRTLQLQSHQCLDATLQCFRWRPSIFGKEAGGMICIATLVSRADPFPNPRGEKRVWCSCVQRFVPFPTNHGEQYLVCIAYGVRFFMHPLLWLNGKPALS